MTTWEDISPWRRSQHHFECETCAATYTVYTQEDDSPEYYTWVYMQCDCGDYVVFELPVN